MNRQTYIFAGIFLAFAAAWVGLVLIPYRSIVPLQPIYNADDNIAMPAFQPGNALAGALVYQAQGCASCHTQQIRGADFGSDIERYGNPDKPRRSVARDYIYESKVFLGSQRSGPDLTNEGAISAKTGKDAAWHHLHLYNPEALVPTSLMAPYAYLYTTRKIEGQPSRDALQLGGNLAPEPGYEIVPTQPARDLVAYILSLNKGYALPEAP